MLPVGHVGRAPLFGLYGEVPPSGADRVTADQPVIAEVVAVVVHGPGGRCGFVVDVVVIGVAPVQTVVTVVGPVVRPLLLVGRVHHRRDVRPRKAVD